jgi:antitoxin ChpS
MYTTTLREANGTFSVEVPDQVVHENHLSPGTPVGVFLQIQQSADASHRVRYSAEQLAREHAEIIDHLDDNRDWINAPAVGRELI